VIPAGRLTTPADRPESGGELFETLARSGPARFERIVTPPGTVFDPDFWYDQTWDEFILLVAGRADLAFEGEETPRRLLPGDWVFIPARIRHRVERTHPTEPAIWLAVHVGEPGGKSPPAPAAISE